MKLSRLSTYCRPILLHHDESTSGIYYVTRYTITHLASKILRFSSLCEKFILHNYECNIPDPGVRIPGWRDSKCVCPWTEQITFIVRNFLSRQQLYWSAFKRTSHVSRQKRNIVPRTSSNILVNGKTIWQNKIPTTAVSRLLRRIPRVAQEKLFENNTTNFFDSPLRNRRRTIVNLKIFFSWNKLEQPDANLQSQNKVAVAF